MRRGQRDDAAFGAFECGGCESDSGTGCVGAILRFEIPNLRFEIFEIPN
jgi:hypothetical protein